MLIQKGGITRDIEPGALHTYKAKGYMPVNEPDGEKQAKASGEKPIEKMTTDELTKKAAELGVDISSCTNNKQRAETILAYIKTTEESSNKE